MREPIKVFLIGPMGAGKSTIGRILAEKLGLIFKDSDREIEERSGANIAWIFDVEGEDGFRDREEAIIDEMTSLSQVVMATGGGVVLREANRDNLKSKGVVVYLETTVDQQYERTRHDRKRPLLKNKNPKEVLQNLFDVRDPLYREIADLVVSTNRGNPRLVVDAIVNYLENQ